MYSRSFLSFSLTFLISARQSLLCLWCWWPLSSWKPKGKNTEIYYGLICFLKILVGVIGMSETHSSYLSQPPQLAVVYFFLAGVLFSIENAKCWPNLANFDQFWLFCREFTEFFGVLFIDLNNAAVY